MVDVLFLYPKSADPQALEDFVSNKFIPMIKQAEGLRSLKVSVDDLMSPSGPPPYSKIVRASFDSLADVMAIVQGQDPAEKRAADHTMKALGVLILLYEVSEP